MLEIVDGTDNLVNVVPDERSFLRERNLGSPLLDFTKSFINDIPKPRLEIGAGNWGSVVICRGKFVRIQANE